MSVILTVCVVDTGELSLTCISCICVILTKPFPVQVRLKY